MLDNKGTRRRDGGQSTSSSENSGDSQIKDIERLGARVDERAETDSFEPVHVEAKDKKVSLKDRLRQYANHAQRAVHQQVTKKIATA